MSQRVTATEPAKKYEPSRPVTLRGLMDILVSEGAPDPDFTDDLEAIQREQPLAGEGPWPS